MKINDKKVIKIREIHNKFQTNEKIKQINNK